MLSRGQRSVFATSSILPTMPSETPASCAHPLSRPRNKPCRFRLIAGRPRRVRRHRTRERSVRADAVRRRSLRRAQWIHSDAERAKAALQAGRSCPAIHCCCSCRACYSRLIPPHDLRDVWSLSIVASISGIRLAPRYHWRGQYSSWSAGRVTSCSTELLHGRGPRSSDKCCSDHKKCSWPCDQTSGISSPSRPTIIRPE
jgi:hypothetical protein